MKHFVFVGAKCGINNNNPLVPMYNHHLLLHWVWIPTTKGIVLLMNLLFHGQILSSKTHNVDFVGHAYAHFLHHFCVVGMLLGLIILIGIEHLVK